MEFIELLKVKKIIEKAIENSFVISINRIQNELLLGFRKAIKIKEYLVNKKIINEFGEILVSKEELNNLI